MLGESFAPETVVVDVGDTVTWVNNGLGGHNARSTDGTFRSPNLTAGASFSHTFTAAGTYDYLCSIHPSNMTGRVVVRGGAATPTTVSPATATLDPATQAPLPPTATTSPTIAVAATPTATLASAATSTTTASPTATSTVSATVTSTTTAQTLRSATIAAAVVDSNPEPTGEVEAANAGGRSWGVPLAIGGFAGMVVAGALLLRRR